ncbi:hypothetical protein [Prevotella sp. AGR2160]|uniref:hypothetical protein n=1 Tax=Prevotella sp. AGR2160 TaxID=1280674 RepID=UPI00041EBD04|nr:hypothetical protein [Prevotella sp. AGR2160]
MKLKNIVLTLGLALSSLAAGAKPSALKVKVYNAGQDAIFQVTSTIVYGKKDAMLVDGQFQKSKAEAIEVVLLLTVLRRVD